MTSGRGGRPSSSASPRGSQAPVRTGTDGDVGAPYRRRVRRRRPTGATIRCRTVVIASGACNRPAVPAFAPRCRRRCEQVTPFDYRNPDQLPDGGVLVVGRVRDRRAARRRAAAVGPAGHAVGRGARAAAAHLPRPRRALVDGRLGRLGRAVRRGRRPRPRPAAAVAAAGRHPRARDPRPQRAAPTWASSWSAAGRRSATARRCSPAACATCSRSPTSSMQRLLDTFDEWARADGRDAEPDPAERPDPTRVPASTAAAARPGAAARSARSSGPPATGPTTPGSTCPVVDEKGQLRHDGGVRRQPGALRARPAGAAPPQVHLHPRHRGRRPRGRRPPGRVPRHARLSHRSTTERPVVRHRQPYDARPDRLGQAVTEHVVDLPPGPVGREGQPLGESRESGDPAGGRGTQVQVAEEHQRVSCAEPDLP